MDITFNDLLTALGLLLLIEGLFYATLPDHAKKMILQLVSASRQQISLIGLIAATIGFLILWFTH